MRALVFVAVGMTIAAVVAPVAPAAAPKDTAPLAPAGLGLLPERPALALRVDPGVLEALADRAASIDELRLPLAVFRIMARTVDFDPTSTASLQQNGFDTAQPVLISLDAPVIDGATGLASSADASRPKAEPRYWVRVVLPVADAARVELALGRLAGNLPTLVDLASGSSLEVASALGAPAADATTLVESLRKLGVRYVGTLPLMRGAMLVHQRAGALVVDAVHLYRVDLDWSRDADALLGLLRDAPKAARGKRAATPAYAAALAAPGFGAWVDAERSFDALIGRATEGAPGWEDSIAKRCADLESIAATGPFTSLALHAAPSSAGLSLSVTWQMRKAYGLAASLLVDDEGLHAVPRDGVAIAGALRLRSLGGLRALPRPASFKDHPVTTAWAIGGCSVDAPSWAMLFAWPQLAAMWLDALGSIQPEVSTVIDGTGNLGFAVESMEVRDFQGVVAVEASFSAAAAEQVTRGAEAVFGHRAERDAVTRWGKGALRPWSRAIGDPAGGRRALGIGYGDASVDWFLGMNRAVTPAPPGSIAELTLSGEHLARLPWSGLDGVRMFLPLLPAVHAELTLDGDALRLRSSP